MSQNGRSIGILLTDPEFCPKVSRAFVGLCHIKESAITKSQTGYSQLDAAIGHGPLLTNMKKRGWEYPIVGVLLMYSK
jgi:hypothetical protein